MATWIRKLKKPQQLSESPLFLEDPDFEDFWYHELMKNKNFETFPGHASLIEFAAIKIEERFSSNDDQVIYLLHNLEVSASYCQFKSRQDYKKFSKILLLLLQEIGVYFTVPKQQLSKSTTYNPPDEIVDFFIDFLLHILQEIHRIHPDFIVSVEGSIEVLRDKLGFLLNFLGDTPCLHPSEVNPLTHIEAVLNKFGSFLYSFFFVRNQVLAPRMDWELSDLLRNFELVETKIKEHCILVSNMPSCTTRKTAVVSLFIVDSLLDDLNHKADKIVGVTDQIVTLHEQLILLRSSLTDITLQHRSQLEELLIQTTDLAYEIEYIINSFPPVWYLTLRLPQFMDKIKGIMMGIKETKKNIDTGIVEVENYPTEQVSSQEKGPLILEDIVVGFDNKEIEIAEQLVRGPEHLQIISIFGMPGVGKTTIAKKLYNNPSVVYHFDKRAWCVVSQTYNKRNIFADILRSVNEHDKEKTMQMDDESLFEALYKSLIKRRYLIVVDDIWDVNAWNDFGRYFPDDKNGSRILFTTRHKEVGLKASHHSVVNELPILSDVECWELLQRKVFQKEHCPQELVDIGKQIAKNCQGLPLAVVVIGAVLEKIEMKEHLWHKVATSLSSVISEDPNKFNNILELSYKHLPKHLKPCFLYFGAFKEDEEMSVKELTHRWVGEGFIKKEEGKNSEDVAYEYLVDLIDRSLIQVAKRTSLGRVKTCNVHDLLHDMCLRIGEEQNFLKEVKSFKRLKIYIWSDRNFSISTLTQLKRLVNVRYLVIPYIVPQMEKFHKLEFLYVQKEVEIPDFLLEMVNLRHMIFEGYSQFSKSCIRRVTEDEIFQINNLQSISKLKMSKKMEGEILRCSPNLRKLKCFLEEFLDLSFLNRLESLRLSLPFKYVTHLISFPLNLRILTLVAVFMSRERAKVIGRLPNLVVLKLKQFCRFEGSQWNTTEGEFQQLKVLKLSLVRVTEWNASSDSFPRLEQLVLKNCNLEIPSNFGDIPTLKMIGVHYCKQSVVESAMQIQKEQREMGYEEVQVIVSSSTEHLLFQQNQFN
ncbi:putative disease resistance RPP13-like protein 3 [Forsythia ovata]|uniref:Disease resistance RPP13-like protein 3 n=1 Tax=Forsythia ovata TaxID=205694 RepID=A0ABD1TUX8_9LAMI